MPAGPALPAAVPAISSISARALGARGPHWGKMHYRDAESLRAAYPRFDNFRAVRDRLDPERPFANGYTERVLGP